MVYWSNKNDQIVNNRESLANLTLKRHNNYQGFKNRKIQNGYVLFIGGWSGQETNQEMQHVSLK